MSIAKLRRPYGFWPSIISARRMAQRTRLEDVQFSGDGLVWLESRGKQGQLVYQPRDGARTAMPIERLIRTSPAGA